MKNLLCLVLLCLAILASPARAYLVGPAPNLAGLNASSPLIAKVTALDSEAVEDALFQKLPLFAVKQTRFRVVSILKDETKSVVPGSEIAFRHYAPTSGKTSIFAMYVPHYYRFVPGRSYLLWAKKSADGWQQFSTAPTEFQRQGALLAPDDAPVEGDIKNVIWQQTNALLGSPDAEDQVAAIETLGAMSSGMNQRIWFSTGDFLSAQVLDAIAPFIESPDDAVAQAAVETANLNAVRVAAPLLAATRAVSNQTRSAALDALRPVKTSAVEARAREAVGDADPIVAAAALRLLSTFPGETTRATWKRTLQNADETRRLGAIEGVQIAHDAPMLPVLAALLDDKNERVQQGAANAMLAFPAATAKNWWEKERKHPKWGPVFVVKLAQSSRDTAAYLPELMRAVAQNREPVTSGQLAVYQSRDLLLEYLRGQTRDALHQPGQFTAIYDALEAPSDLGQTLSLYQFYRSQGLKTRAQNLRARTEAKEPRYKDYFEQG